MCSCSSNKNNTIASRPVGVTITPTSQDRRLRVVVKLDEKNGQRVIIRSKKNSNIIYGSYENGDVLFINDDDFDEKLFVKYEEHISYKLINKEEDNKVEKVEVKEENTLKDKLVKKRRTYNAG